MYVQNINMFAPPQLVADQINVVSSRSTSSIHLHFQKAFIMKTEGHLKQKLFLKI